MARELKLGDVRAEEVWGGWGVCGEGVCVEKEDARACVGTQVVVFDIRVEGLMRGP